MSHRLEGKVAIVTGASRGIGRAIALKLADEGAHVACIATSQANAEKTAGQLSVSGRAYGCDISNYSDFEEVYKQIEADLGTPLILVNNAGITKDALILRMSEQDFMSVIEVNLKGCFHTIKIASRQMMKSRWGRIINISSIVGLHGAPGQVNYAASKAGIIGMTLATAKELGSRGITCNAVAPGFIETDMTSDLPVEMREQVLKSAPLGRLGTPEDIANVVAFMASEDAGYMTGQTLTVEGGLTI